MITTSKFQELHNKQVSRNDLENLLHDAKKEQNTNVVFRLSKILNNNPSDPDAVFALKIKQYKNTPVKQVTYKEALTNKGTLKKGWLFKNGAVVKAIAPKTNKTPKLDQKVPIEFLAGLEYIELQDSDLEQGLNAPVSPAQIYQMITDKMIKAVNEASGLNYIDEWDENYTTGAYLVPTNFVSKKGYRGINTFLLKGANLLGVFKNPYFLTFKQIVGLKGKLKKGSKGLEVVYFTRLFQFENKEKKQRFSTYTKQKMIGFLQSKGYDPKQFDFLVTVLPILKYYNVFNGDDVTGIDFGLDKLTDLEKAKLGYVVSKPNTEAKNSLAEAILKNLPPKSAKIQKSPKGGAYYSPKSDTVNVPVYEAFKSANDYYRVLFHELIHSTAHKTRLDRNLTGKFGSLAYAKEELVAEFGAVFLSAQAGILWHTNKNHSEYIKNWLTAITLMKKDNRLLMRCASAAQKATDYLLQVNQEKEPKFYKDLKTEKAVEQKNELGFSKEDIPYELAFRAHTGTSFSPEKRAKSHQNEYYSYLKSVYELNYEKALKLDQKEEFKTKFLRFKNGYLKRYLAYLNSKNGMMSTMITGASNFPVNRMRKKSETINKRLNELIEFGEKYDNFFKPKAAEKIKTGSSDALEKLNKKLSSLEEQHSLMKKGNAVINAVLRKKGLDKDKQIRQIAIGFEDFFKQKVIETWVDMAKRETRNLKNTKFFLTNLTAKIRNVKKQITLEKRLSKNAEEKGNTEIPFENGTVIINRTINKIQILFDHKPDIEVRSFLKKSGQAFKWSPKNGVWQRQLNTYYSSNKKDLLEFLKVTKQPKENTPKQLELSLNGSTQQPEKIQVVAPTVQNINPSNLHQEEITITAPEIIKPKIIPEQNTIKTPVEIKNTGRNSLAIRRQKMQGREFELYDVCDFDMAAFLGKIEFKTKESLVLTIAGEQGSGKTRFAYRFMNILAQKYKVGHASMEEHPESKLYWDKVDEYINDTALNNIDNPEIKNLTQLDKLIRENDVIVIDSFAKLKEFDRKFEVDKDLRKKYNSKLFLIVFQLTSDGSMRGGTASQFDGDSIFFVDKKPDYKDSFVYANKNRYQSKPLNEIHYNIYSGKLNNQENYPNSNEVPTELQDVIV